LREIRQAIYWGAAIKACPAGWHLPTNEEWDELVSFAGGDEAGTKLKSKSPDWNGTDDCGFSALPGGYRLDNAFLNPGLRGYWWAAVEGTFALNYIRIMSTDYTYVDDSYWGIKGGGMSVRCLRD
jgi:uncharacterized protein (TIGR02145 family)